MIERENACSGAWDDETENITVRRERDILIAKVRQDPHEPL